MQLIESGLLDATYVLRILCDLNAIPLALQITNVCGNVMVSPKLFCTILLCKMKNSKRDLFAKFCHKANN